MNANANETKTTTAKKKRERMMAIEFFEFEKARRNETKKNETKKSLLNECGTNDKDIESTG